MYQEFYTTAPDYARLRQAMLRLGREYPDIRVFSFGQSVLGRELYALAIGEVRGATVYLGGVHGSEWITTLLLLRFAGELLERRKNRSAIAQIDVCRALENRPLVIIPCLNPDGVEIALHQRRGALELGEQVEAICGGDYSCWQANANGVDLNHNFDAGWELLKSMELEQGIHRPSKGKYGGEAPHSQPESAAIVNFCTDFEVRSLYTFHAQGEEIYYKYGPHTPLRSQLMAQVLASSCGYEVRTPTGTASHGGLKDWFIQEFGRPGFTIEVGRGQNPLPIDQLEPIYRRLREMLMLGIII